MKFGSRILLTLINWQKSKTVSRKNGLYFLYLFDRTVKAKLMKKKDSRETVKAFSSIITKSNRPKKIWVDKGDRICWSANKFCAAEGIQVYFTMSGTIANFAECTIRSLKKIFTVTWRILYTSKYTNYLNLSLL